MLSIPLGPLALPVGPVLLLAAVWLGGAVAARLLTRPLPQTERAPAADAASQAFWTATLLGLLTARLVHLGLHAQAYLASPLSMLDIRDGGWHAPAGALAGAAWLAWRGRQWPAARRPLALGGLAALGVWLLGSLATAPHGTPMPDAPLVALDGGRATNLRGAAAGRPVVVNLWASWCGPCRQEMPTLAAAQQRETAVGFLFVNQGEPPAVVQAYLGQLGQPLREVLLDAASALGPVVGSPGLPTTLFYDAQGRLVDAHFGVLNAAALESRLRTLRKTR